MRNPQAALRQKAIGLDRGHCLRELVEVVVEVARKDERALLGDRALLAAVDVRGLDRHVMDEGGAWRLLDLEREAQRVQRARYVGAERVLKAVVEGHARRAVDDVRQRLTQPGDLSRRDPKVRPFDVTGDEAEAPGARSGDLQPLQEQRSPLGGREHLHDLFRLGIAQRLGADHRDHFGHTRVRSGLRQDLLAHEARGPGQQDPEAGIAAARLEPRLGIGLELLHAFPKLSVREMRGLAKAKREGGVDHPEQALGPFRGRAAARRGAHPARETVAQRVDGLQATPHDGLPAGEPNHAARDELSRHLQRVTVAVRVHEQLVRIDRPRNLPAGGETDAGDVAAG